MPSVYLGNLGTPRRDIPTTYRDEIITRRTFSSSTRAQGEVLHLNPNIAILRDHRRGVHEVRHVPTGIVLSSRNPSSRLQALALAEEIGTTLSLANRDAGGFNNSDINTIREIARSGRYVNRAREMRAIITERRAQLTERAEVEEIETYECEWCGETEEEPAAYDNGSTTLCPECQDESVECHHCNEAVPQDQTVCAADGEQYCEECRDERLTCCDGCEEWIDQGESYYLETNGWNRDRDYCESCYVDCTTQCDSCHDRFHNDDIYHYNIDVCEACRTEYTECAHCEDVLIEPGEGFRIDDDDDDDDYFNSDYEEVCYRCHRNHLRDQERQQVNQRPTNSILEGTVRETERVMPGYLGFGFEIEVEFGSGCPFPLTGYHSRRPSTDSRLFGGWRAEQDGSLSMGGEFISPPLHGAAGLAEVIATYELLKEEGAGVPRTTGQHVTVMADSFETRVEVQRLTLALEEALFATTGSFKRANNHGYSRRIKADSHGVNYLKQKRGYQGGGLTAVLKTGTLVEMRYPPGTLVAEQAAINLGLCRHVVELARNTTIHPEINDLIEAALTIEAGEELQHQRIHQQIVLGLRFLAKHGWNSTDGGDMPGLPYDPLDAPTIQLVSQRGEGTEVEIKLPPRRAILRRMERQIMRFYEKLARHFELSAEDRDDMAEEALECLEIETGEEVETKAAAEEEESERTYHRDERGRFTSPPTEEEQPSSEIDGVPHPGPEPIRPTGYEPYCGCLDCSEYRNWQDANDLYNAALVRRSEQRLRQTVQPQQLPPTDPEPGIQYTGPSGTSYTFNGTAWVVNHRVVDPSPFTFTYTGEDRLNF